MLTGLHDPSHNPEETMKEKRLLKPPVRTPEVDRWLRYWASRAGQHGKGTPERKARAKHAADVRWGNVPKPSTITPNP